MFLGNFAFGYEAFNKLSAIKTAVNIYIAKLISIPGDLFL